MPVSAPRPCSFPTCRVLVRNGSGRCAKHPREQWQKQVTATPRITGRRLQALQERYDQATLTSVQLLERERDAKDKSNLALYEQTVAAEKARAAADALAETNAAIKADIDELVKASLPLAEQRALEVKGMAASTLALYEQREALKTQAKAVAEAKVAADAKAAAEKAAAEALARTNESYQQQIDAILKSRMSEAEPRSWREYVEAANRCRQAG